MASTLNRLTARRVKQATVAQAPYKLFDGGGLFLHVQSQGRYWRLKYRFQGREKLLALGVYPQISLKEARRRRDWAKSRLAEGIDPMSDRQAQSEQNSETFEELAFEYLEKEKTRLAPATIDVHRRRLENHVLPSIGKSPIKELEPPAILRVLRSQERASSYETAHRLRQLIGRIFRYAVATGRAERDPTADLSGALRAVPKTNRAAITTPNEAGVLIRSIDAYRGQPVTRLALWLLALTFVRPGELRLARWEEIDWEQQIWRIPAGRMKIKREHLVPLSSPANQFLNELKVYARSSLIFEGQRRGRPISENTLNVALRNIGYDKETMTSHGFRALASTLLHEQGWPPEIIELQLAHSPANRVAAAYNRSSRLIERRQMLEQWGHYLTSFCL